MEAVHVFIKGRSGDGIFYRSEDFLVLITIVSVLVRDMGLILLAFCPMFNHIHFLFKRIDRATLSRFLLRLTATFVREYNKEYERKGPLFQKQYGCSVKKAVKIILGCVAYVFNNPVAGKLFKSAKEYKWSLLAYQESDAPFSPPLKQNSCRNRMRIALTKVNYFYSNGKYLSHDALRSIFKDLNSLERKQITDYILFKYNFISRESLKELYGGLENMFLAIESNAGSEYDLEDEYGDHSCYRTMLDVVMRLGYKDQGLNFEKTTKEESDYLFRLLRGKTKAPATSVNKFLHRRTW